MLAVWYIGIIFEVHKNNHSFSEGSSPSEKRDLVTELNLLKDLSHPNVVRLLGACTDEGELFTLLINKNRYITIRWFSKILSRVNLG